MPSDFVPMRWPSEWTDEARLELIRDTPVNCLVGEQPPPFPLGNLKFLHEGEAPDGVVLRDGIWPQVQGARERDSASAGPTGGPWVDSNAATLRLAQALEPGKKVWLTYQPPPASETTRFELLPVPVVEAEAYSGRWVITLHESLRQGIEKGDEKALSAWKKMMEALEFSRSHTAWDSWKPVAALAVVSDFEGDNELLSHEFVNLAPRHHLAYEIVPEDRAGDADLSGFKGILYAATTPPGGPLRSRLLEFAGAGGLLILPAAVPELSGSAEQKYDYEVYRHGRGSVAVPREEWYDPYVLTQQVHLLLSHRNDVLRIWNGGSMNSYYLAPPGGGRGVVHLVNYGGRRNLEAVTLGFRETYRRARIYTLDDVQEVRGREARMGTEVPLPAFGAYAVVELEG